MLAVVPWPGGGLAPYSTGRPGRRRPARLRWFPGGRSWSTRAHLGSPAAEPPAPTCHRLTLHTFARRALAPLLQRLLAPAGGVLPAPQTAPLVIASRTLVAPRRPLPSPPGATGWP